MIVVAIIALSGVVIALLVSAFANLPAMPEGVFGTLDTLVTYFVQGAKVLMSFVYGDVVVALWGFLLAFIGVYEGYKLVMWIVKKLPMFGVSD